jgi:DNA-binding GntR family transcriptional regulator
VVRSATNASFSVYSQIKQSIIDLIYSPGEKLSESGLADELGVGRSPIRTALARLESEGWVEVSPQSGTFVRALSAREIDDLSELRGILEAHCIGLTAERISQKELTALEDAFREYRTRIHQGDAEAFIHIDNQLHALSYRLGGNELIAETLTALRDKVEWIRRACADSGERVLEGFGEIEAILEALVRHDAAAARELMKKHIESAARFCQMSERLRQHADQQHSSTSRRRPPSQRMQERGDKNRLADPTAGRE